jgi:hypothetical protein
MSDVFTQNSLELKWVELKRVKVDLDYLVASFLYALINKFVFKLRKKIFIQPGKPLL